MEFRELPTGRSAARETIAPATPPEPAARGAPRIAREYESASWHLPNGESLSALLALLPRSGLSFRVQLKPLHSPTSNLRNRDFVVVAAIDLMNSSKFSGHLATLAELSYHGPVELHLVDFATHGIN